MIACATTQMGGDSTKTILSGTTVKANVAVDGKVDQDEIHLSKSRTQQVNWDTAGAALQIVPDEDPASWPLEVKCTGGHCEGTQKPDAQVGKHQYHTVVGEKAGTDPFIIIDP
jgi:hypothetical protein